MSLSSDNSRCPSSLGSDDLLDISFYIMEDLLPPTPPPTSDEECLSLMSLEDELQMMSVSTLGERPETSTSSLFSFVADRERETPLPATALTLPTFIVPANPGFFDSETASDITPISRFHKWMDVSRPEHETFAEEVAAENAIRPRMVRSAPAIPSLFRRMEYECGYCKSVGHARWHSHTRRTCRQLRSLPPCKICGAIGELNHTETYCPSKPSVCLPLTDTFLAELDTHLADRQRHFDKYSDLIERIYPNDSF